MVLKTTQRQQLSTLAPTHMSQREIRIVNSLPKHEHKRGDEHIEPSGTNVHRIHEQKTNASK